LLGIYRVVLLGGGHSTSLLRSIWILETHLESYQINRSYNKVFTYSCFDFLHKDGIVTMIR